MNSETDNNNSEYCNSADKPAGEGRGMDRNIFIDSNLGLGVDTLLDIIIDNPYSIAVFGSDGRFISCNKAYNRMFPILPTQEYSIFEDPIIDAHGFGGLVNRLREGETIRFPEMAYNPKDINPEFPDIQVYMSIVAFPIMDGEGRLDKVVSIHENVTEQRMAEKSLRESEEKFRAFSESSIYVYGEMNLAGDFTYVNDNMAHVSGYSREELLGMNYRDIVVETELERAEGDLEQVLEKPFDAPGEFRLLRKDGSISHVEINTLPMKKDGFVTGFQFTALDVTKRKKAEEEIRRLNQFLGVVVDHANVWLDVLDMDSNVVIWNKSAEEISGYTAEEAIGNFQMWELLYPDEEYRKEILGKAESIIDTGESVEDYETEIVTKRGERRVISWYSRKLQDDEGRPMGLVSLGRDVTEKKKTEEALRKSEQEFRLAFESAKDAIFWAEADTGIIINCNPAAEKMLERDRDEITGMHQTELHPPDEIDRYIGVFKTHVREKGAVDIEAEVITKSGRRVPVHISSSITYIDGKPINQGIFRDITNLKKAEEEKTLLQDQLQQAQKMEAVGTLAGGMAHDFNNSLSVIMGNLEIALKETGGNDRLHERLEKILTSAERAKDLTIRLLTFSRKDLLNVKTVSPNDIVGDLIDTLNRSISKKISIVSELEPSVVPVDADRNQILQALLNICINASDAMGEAGGRLSIHTSSYELDESSGMPGLPPGRCCLIEVSDTGPGIHPDDQKKIFDPFFTTKEREKGTGLGLSVTLGIITKHGGAIDIVSAPGEGATFRIFLPAGSSEPVPSEDKPTDIDTGGGETILIIDDDRDFVDMIAEALEIGGFGAVVSHTCAEALRIFSDKKDEIDLVLMDMEMPGMDGTEVFRKLRDIDPAARILISSGYSRDGQAEELLASGAAGFIQKPFNADELYSAINDSLQQR